MFYPVQISTTQYSLQFYFLVLYKSFVSYIFSTLALFSVFLAHSRSSLRTLSLSAFLYSFLVFDACSQFCLFTCFLYVCLNACREQRRTQFEISHEDEELQEQELKTWSSYYMNLRQVYSLIIFCPNNIYFTLASINFGGYLFILFVYLCP